MSAELREKADIIMRELNDALAPLKEELEVRKSGSFTVDHRSAYKQRSDTM